MSTVVPSGWTSGETEPSGLSITEPERPMEFGPVSVTLTRMLAARLLDVAKIGRAAPEPPGIVTSKSVFEDAWRNEACPPGGWFAIERWNVRISFVWFCSVTTKARWSAGSRGLASWGEPTRSPSVTRLM